MSDKEIFCKNCRFFNLMEGECRRRAPAHPHPMEYILPAHLQAISLSALKLARLDAKSEIFDKDITDLTTEYYRPSLWPSVKDNYWCGEFEEAPDDQDEALK